MLIARHPTIYSPPEPWSCSWEELRAFLLSPAQRIGDKMNAPLWSPAEWIAGCTEKVLPNVVNVQALVLDLDDVPITRVGDVARAVNQAGVAAVLHSSYGAPALFPHRTKFRLVIPLSHPVPRARWSEVWDRGAAKFAPYAGLDTKCRDASHAYYVPSCAPDADPRAVWSFALEGTYLDPDALPAAKDLPKQAPTRPALLEEMQKLAKDWSKRKKPRQARLGMALEQMLQGQPYAYPGERDQVTFELASDLAKALDDCTAESLAAYFGPSLLQMGHDAPTLASVVGKIERARQREDKPEVSPAHPNPYMAVSAEGGAYYFRTRDDWLGPFQGDGVDKAARDLLLPWYEAGEVVLHKQTERGPVELNRKELLMAYGSTILEHEIVLGANRSVMHEGKFYEARARLRKLEPFADPSVLSWLHALADGDPKKLRDLVLWLGIVPRLQEPIAALTLIGAKGVGKSLFAESLARLWTEGNPTKADDALSEYNGGILRCPLVWADEQIPSDARGRPRTEELRAMVSAYGHTITRKYLPSTVARGCVRIVISIQGEHKLGFRGDLTPEDVDAIAERLYILKPNPGRMAEFYAANPGVFDYLKRGDGLARFALAAEAQYPKTFRREHRFLISGGDLHARAIAAKSGRTPDLLAWIVGWLMQPGKLGGMGRLSHVASDRKILISIEDVLQSWSHYVPEAAVPPSRPQLISALRGIATRERAGAGPRLWSVRHEAVRDWIEESSSAAEPLDTLLDRSIRKI